MTAIAEAPGKLTVRELSEATSLPRPTVYRLLSSLIESGLVKPSASGHTYQLGNTLLMIAHRALDQTDIRDIAHEHLVRLRDQTGETVHLAVFHNNMMLYVDNLESRERVRMTCSLGVSVPLHSTAVGKAYLAALPAQERDAILDQLSLTNVTGKSITTLDALRAEIATATSHGWAADEEENERDIFCYGAPVLNREGRPVACISISIPRFRMQAEVETAYVGPLLETSQAVSRILGHFPRPATSARRQERPPAARV
ncbi:MAG: IclR family transcriptional regulator [Bradyrhizobium sp.]|nr:IclR family transcriptional regulator [Bradyrhizobium sp.]